MALAIVTGIATRINKRNGLGDLFVPGAFDQFIRDWSNGRGEPVQIMAGHQIRNPQKTVGAVTRFTASATRLTFEGEISDETQAGQELIHLVAQGYLRALSITYPATEFRVVEKGWDIERSEVMEVSIVWRGADPGARITSIRYTPDPPAAAQAEFLRDINPQLLANPAAAQQIQGAHLRPSQSVV